MDIETYINLLYDASDSQRSSANSDSQRSNAVIVPRYTIINLDKPAHWVPILNGTNSIHYHNSSSNIPPPDLLKALKHYIIKTHKKLYINNIQEQFYPETNCGPRALEYLLASIN